jgi:glycosyltransferase involved in cell wall biosynthesis
MGESLRVSILIPTLNSERTLGLCLDSLAAQDYPRDRVEIVFADGGSVDTTQSVIKSFHQKNPGFQVIVKDNPLKTGEAGKAVALKASSGAITAFIDSDNILESRDWLGRMLAPFEDKDIIAAEPIRYTYRAQDPPMTRYCALLGMNDPLCYFLGNYDRECVLSGRWTEAPYLTVEDREDYRKLRLDPKKLPTMGANGFFIRRDIFLKKPVGDYLFDIDILAEELSERPNVFVAKVNIGIVHIFSSNLKSFWRKQLRRIADYRYFNSQKLRRYPWGRLNKIGLIYFIVSCFFVLPLIVGAIRGYIKKKDVCWVYHPLMCWITCAAYAWGAVGLKNQPLSRSTWQTYGKA